MRVTLRIERWVPVLLGLLGCMTEVDLEEAELELEESEASLTAAAGGAEFPCFGWGRTRCDDPSSSGELHEGYIPISSSSATHIRYTPGVIGNIFAAGDSGGACYAPTRGGHDRLLGVTNQGSCASRVGIQVRATAIADWFEQQVDRTHYESSFSSSIGWTLVWQPVNALPALDGAPIWNVTGCKLVEPTDSRGDAVTREGNLMLQRAAIVMNGYVQVSASGSDTDGSTSRIDPLFTSVVSTRCSHVPG